MTGKVAQAGNAFLPVLPDAQPLTEKEAEAAIRKALPDFDHYRERGLIINELISNSLKYAFPHGKPGSIFLALRRIGEETELKYRDDGPGCPGIWM